MALAQGHFLLSPISDPSYVVSLWETKELVNKKVRKKSRRKKGISKLNSWLLCGAFNVTVILYQSQEKKTLFGRNRRPAPVTSSGTIAVTKWCHAVVPLQRRTTEGSTIRVLICMYGPDDWHRFSGADPWLPASLPSCSLSTVCKVSPFSATVVISPGWHSLLPEGPSTQSAVLLDLSHLKTETWKPALFLAMPSDFLERPWLPARTLGHQGIYRWYFYFQSYP